MSLLWLIVSWIIYFTLHSIFALTAVKHIFYSFGLRQQTYRLIYNLFAILLLIPILIISSRTNSNYLFDPTSLFKFLGLVLATWGIIIVKIAFKSYDTKAFLGLGNLDEENKFSTDGLLKSVRHPLYSGSILIIVGYLLFDPKITTLISVSMMIIYFIIGIRFEERKLIKTFGGEYQDYKRKTPMLIPRFWRKS